jgi:ABC-type lipoprotein export system ATPase subunit
MTTATGSDAQALIRVLDGHTVWHGVDLPVPDGELVAVMGPPGSSKSTLLSDFSGVDTLMSGSVLFAGYDLATPSQEQLPRLRLTTMRCTFQHVYVLANLCLLDTWCCRLPGPAG